MNFQYAILIGDGMADFPVPELGGLTPLAYAKTPAMDAVAGQGVVGLARTIPDGFAPGSDVANMSLMGFDPTRFYSGRAPLEAAALGVSLGQGDTAFRCNLITLAPDAMKDYSAGHISTAESHRLVAELKKVFDSDRVTLHPGVSYRHLLVVKGFPRRRLDCTPPHDISGRTWKEHLPQGDGAELLVELMDKARPVLAASAVNRERLRAGKNPATDVWFWGQGAAVKFPTLKERYGLSGSVVSAVDLVRGLGVLSGLKVRMVEGATGYLGTNYRGKVAAAVDALHSEDLVFVHIEAPDETSHEGDLAKKIQAIEEFDERVVAPILDLREWMPKLRILVMPDHATPVSMKTHHAMPVPYAACGAGIPVGERTNYSEKAAEGSPIIDGHVLFDRFIRTSLV